MWGEERGAGGAVVIIMPCTNVSRVQLPLLLAVCANGFPNGERCHRFSLGSPVSSCLQDWSVLMRMLQFYNLSVDRIVASEAACLHETT